MSDDVMVSKVILQEQRGNFLLSDVKEEPRVSTPTPSTCSDNSHIPITTAVHEVTQPTNQIQLGATFSYISPPPYFSTAERLNIPGTNPHTWPNIYQQQISGTSNEPLMLHNVSTLQNCSPTITTVSALTPVLLSGVFPSNPPQQFHHNQPLPNPIPIQNSSSSALVSTRLHFPLNETISSSSIGNNAFYGFLPGSGNPSILQSSGPTVYNAFNHNPVHPLYHSNKYLLAPQHSPTISTSTVSTSSYLPSNLPIHVQPSMITLNPTIESTDDISRIISNSFNVENRTHGNNNNNIVSQTVIHPNVGSSYTSHLSNKNSIPRELAHSSYESSHQHSLIKSTIRKSSSTEPVSNINKIQSISSGAVATTVQTVSTTTGVPVLDKQIHVTVCSTSATTMTTTSSTAPTIDNNFDPIIENAFDGVLWGRIYRRADGDLMLPGLGTLCTFKSSNSVLRQICQMTKTDDSLALQLSPSRVQSEIEKNHLSTSPLNPSSKKGLHICLCCRLTFTSNSVYECHLNRSIAHMYYRCHICIQLNSNNNVSTTNANSVNSMLIPNVTTGTDSSIATTTITTTNTAINNKNEKIANHKNVTDFQFYSILPGYIIKANNHCAIFSHFTSAHPNQMGLWTLEPSLLTMYSLRGSITSVDLKKSSLSDLLSNAPKEKTLNQLSNQSDRFPSDPFSNHICLSGILSDLHQSLNNISGLDNFDLLHPSLSTSLDINNKNSYDYNSLSDSPIISASDYDDNIIIEKFYSLQRIYKPIVIHSQKQITNETTTDNNIHHRQLHYDLHLPKLPSSDSLLFRIILSLANSDIWQSHLFLSNWCDNNSNNSNKSSSNENGGVDKWSTFMCCYAANNKKNNSSDILFSIDDDDDDDYGDGDDDGDDEDRNRDYGRDFHSNINSNSSDKSVIDRNFQSRILTKPLSLPKLCDTCLPPSAPSIAYLNQALGSLISSKYDDHHASMCSTNTTVSRTSDNICKPRSMISNSDQKFGILRCLICKFRTNNHKSLIEHLIGSPPLNHTKCGLCGQLLFANQPSLCSVKAHLLLHLGCFLMCPQCGFTPPLHLPPDCAELCLRVHLRFVCYHFNLKEIFRCNYCDGDGKAYPTYDNLCHHHLGHHVKRIYSCLWCAQQTCSSNSESHNNNNTNYTSTKAFQISETTGDNASIPVHDVLKRKLTSAAYHTASIHMNKENIKLTCSTTTSHTNSRSNSSAHGSVNSSIPNKTQNIFRSNSIQEFLCHFKSVHWSSIVSSAIEKTNKCGAVQHEIEQSSDNILTIDVPESPPPRSLHPAVVVVGNKQTSSVNNDVRKVGNCVGNDGVTSSDPQKSSKYSDVIQMIDELQKIHTNDNNKNVKNKLSIKLAPKVDYGIELQCIECSKEFSTREHYMEHFQKEHTSKCNRGCFYRCFGACKRLLPNIHDFREHLAECRHAQSIFYSTFGHFYNKDKAFDLFNVDSLPINVENDNNNNNKHTIDERQEQFNVNNTDRIYSRNVHKINKHNINDNSNTIQGCKLCFCAYCGIGSQKSMMNSSSINLPDPVLSSLESCTSDDGNSIPNISNVTTNTTSNNDDDNSNSQLNNGVNAVLQSQFSVDSISTGYLSEDDPTGFDTTKQPMHNSTINNHNTNIQRYNLYTPKYFSNLINLHIHENNCHYSKRNKLIACPWCHIRMTCRKKDKTRATHMHLFSHLHEHCMATWCLERMRKWNENAKVLPNCVCGLALLDSPQAILSHAGVHLLYTNKYNSSNIIPDSLQHRSYKHSLSSSPLKSQLNSSEECLLPKPSDHIPCPIKIYRHLRFGVSAKFDTHLSEFSHRSSYFTCPVCMTKLNTRWALTQHAFSEHWGTLCYICCVYTVKPIEENSSAERNNHNTNPPNLSTISSSSSCPSSSSPSTAASVATFDRSNRNDKSKSDLSTTTLWDHIFLCMNKRLELLTTCHHSTPTSSSLIGSRNDQNNSECSLEEIQSNFEKENDDLSVPNATIVIDSSPESCDHGKLVSSQQNNWSSCSGVVNTSSSSISTNITSVITTSNTMLSNPSTFVGNSVSSSITTATSSFTPSTDNSDKYVHKIFNKKSLEIKNTYRKRSLQLDNTYDNDDDDDRDCVGEQNVVSDYVTNTDHSMKSKSHIVNNCKLVIKSKSSGLNTIPQSTSDISKKRRISKDLDDHTKNHGACHDEMVKNNLTTCSSSAPATHSITTSSSMNYSTFSGNYLHNSDLDEQECSTICPDDNDVNTEKICVICGKKQTADTWEEHCLSHRNPKMAWDGVRISQPDRPAFCEVRPIKVYRCYICYRRFTIRSSCFRHMTTVHHLKKSQLDANLLTELSSPNSKRTNCPELNKLSSDLGNCSLSLSNHIKNSKSHISLKKSVNITSTTTNSSITTTTTTTTSPLKHHSIYNNISNTVDSKKNKNRSLVSSSMSKSKYYCSICHVSFISNESLSRHCMSAHGQQRKQRV
ncbi:unnamed protein product [Schistosoma bovis]|nr:unnamed protein product [Schistosoma bovis]